MQSHRFFCVFSGLPVYSSLKKYWRSLIKFRMDSSCCFPVREQWVSQVETPGRGYRLFLPWEDIESVVRRFQTEVKQARKFNRESANSRCHVGDSVSQQTGEKGPQTHFKINFMFSLILKVRGELCVAAGRLQTFRFWNEVFVDRWRSKLCQNYVIKA